MPPWTQRVVSRGCGIAVNAARDVVGLGSRWKGLEEEEEEESTPPEDGNFLRVDSFVAIDSFQATLQPWGLPRRSGDRFTSALPLVIIKS